MQCPKLRRSVVAMIWGCRCPIPLILTLTSNASIGVPERTQHSRQWRGWCARVSFRYHSRNWTSYWVVVSASISTAFKRNWYTLTAVAIVTSMRHFLPPYLKSLGLERSVIQRVILFAPITAAPRTHMFLTVELPEGRFV